MQTLTGLAPLVAFFVTYRWGGLYVATAVLMVTMVLVLGVDWLRERRIPPVHALSAVLVLVFGGGDAPAAQPRLHPVEADGAAAGSVGLAFLGSFWVGKRTLTERFLGTAIEERVRGERRLLAHAQCVVGGVLRARRARSISPSRTMPARAPG